MALSSFRKYGIILLLFDFYQGSGQQLELGINFIPGLAHTQQWEAGMNGAGFNVDYLHPVKEDISLRGGVELGYTGWGSQGLMALGFVYGSTNALELELLNGMAFYQQGPNYVFGCGASYIRSFFNQGKNLLILSIGLRYSIQPAYRSYGPIYSYLDIPIQLRWGRKLR